MLVKMFVFVIIIILFISRIKNTKTDLTKEEYEKKFEKEYHKNEKYIQIQNYSLNILRLKAQFMHYAMDIYYL